MPNMYYRTESGEQYLIHHGIRGQRWGIRRFQNKDGSLTEAGKKRQAKLDARAEKKRIKMEAKAAAKKAKTDLENKRHEDSLEGKLSKAKHMSDAEIKRAIERMDLEVKYRDAVKRYNADELAANQAKQARANKIKDRVTEGAAEVSKNLAKNLIATAASKSINTIAGMEIISKKELLTGQIEERKAPKKTNLNKDRSEMTDDELKAAKQRAADELNLKQNLDKLSGKGNKETDSEVAARHLNGMSEEERKKWLEAQGISHSDEFDDDDEYAGDPVPLEDDDYEFKQAEFFVKLLCWGD